MNTEQIKRKDSMLWTLSECRKMNYSKYPSELKAEILEYMKLYDVTVVEMSNITNIHQNTLSNWKKELKPFKVREVKHGRSGKRYTLSVKVEACERVLNSGESIEGVRKALSLGHGTVQNWLVDYQKGLYSLENTVQVTRKKVRSYEVIIQEIEDLSEKLETKKVEAKEALTKEYEYRMAKL